MHLLRSALCLALTFVSLPASAWVVRIPPDPAALKAAEALVAALPLSEAVPSSPLDNMVSANAYRDAEASLLHLHKNFSVEKDSAYLTAEIEVAVRRGLPGVAGRIAPALAQEYAYWMPISDMEAVTALLKTPAGKTFGAMYVRGNIAISLLVEQDIWARLSPQLPTLLAAAQERRALVERVNRETSRQR